MGGVKDSSPPHPTNPPSLEAALKGSNNKSTHSSNSGSSAGYKTSGQQPYESTKATPGVGPVSGFTVGPHSPGASSVPGGISPSGQYNCPTGHTPSSVKSPSSLPVVHSQQGGKVHPAASPIMGTQHGPNSMILPGVSPHVSAQHVTPSSSGGSVHTCMIANCPLQTWVNVVVSVYGRTLDIYINGKLLKSCVLPGIAKPSSAKQATLTPGGGFAGYTALAEYWSSGTNADQAYMIYLSGGGVPVSTEGGTDSYRVKVSFLDNGTEEGSFEL